MKKTPDYDSKSSMENAPQMWMSEINFIKNSLLEIADNKKKINILEWGSGSGTIYFSKFLKEKNIQFHWYAIEHFVPWYKKVIKMLKDNCLEDEVEILLKSATLEEDKILQEREDLSDYIHSPKYLNKKFDFILIDGRRRAECLISASHIISKNGIVVLHDAERPWFHSGFEPYKNKGKFVTENITPAAWGGIQKMWMGKLDE